MNQFQESSSSFVRFLQSAPAEVQTLLRTVFSERENFVKENTVKQFFLRYPAADITKWELVVQMLYDVFSDSITRGKLSKQLDDLLIYKWINPNQVWNCVELLNMNCDLILQFYWQPAFKPSLLLQKKVILAVDLMAVQWRSFAGELHLETISDISSASDGQHVLETVERYISLWEIFASSFATEYSHEMDSIVQHAKRKERAIACSQRKGYTSSRLSARLVVDTFL